MSKNKKQARVYYQERDGREGYAIEIRVGTGNWSLESWFPCVERKDSSDGGTDYLHWSILAKFSTLQNLGYELDFLRL